MIHGQWGEDCTAVRADHPHGCAENDNGNGHTHPRAPCEGLLLGGFILVGDRMVIEVVVEGGRPSQSVMHEPPLCNDS
jgi:hypothetical protein